MENQFFVLTKRAITQRRVITLGPIFIKMVLNQAQGLKEKSQEVSARKNNNRQRYNKKCRRGVDSTPLALLGLMNWKWKLIEQKFMHCILTSEFIRYDSVSEHIIATANNFPIDFTIWHRVHGSEYAVMMVLMPGGGGGFFKKIRMGMLKVEFKISTISIPRKVWFCDPSLYHFSAKSTQFGANWVLF